MRTNIPWLMDGAMVGGPATTQSALASWRIAVTVHLTD
jgi:hypothetical protein